MKYQAELAEVARLLPTVQNILIALPSATSVDELAGGLALFLSLETAGKEAAIVTEGTIRVGHTNLFGVGEIQSKIPEGKGGDFIITLGGVAVAGPDGKSVVPALEKADYFAQGTDLNMIFKVLPGQKFEPTSVTPHYQGSSFGLIFVLGASSPAELGGIYSANGQLFSTAHLINIDNNQGNARFAASNVIDPAASSISEMVSQILAALNLPTNGDIATNILSGIFAATADLRERNAGADTYEVVAAALRAGGQRPALAEAPAGLSAALADAAPVPVAGFDLSKVFQAPAAPVSVPAESFTVPPVVGSNQVETEPAPQSSPEEAPAGEGVEVVSPEDDWLTPKILHGKSTLG